MNKEIKEILNQLEIVGRKHTIEICEDGSKIETMPASVVNELRLNNYSAKILLDYITILQKENEELKEEIQRQSKALCINDKLLVDYRDRIDKAIEYLKEHTDKVSTIRVPKLDFSYNELLKILGGDEE